MEYGAQKESVLEQGGIKESNNDHRVAGFGIRWEDPPRYLQN
jgi:hypothetical protein